MAEMVFAADDDADASCVLWTAFSCEVHDPRTPWFDTVLMLVAVLVPPTHAWRAGLAAAVSDVDALLVFVAVPVPACPRQDGRN